MAQTLDGVTSDIRMDRLTDEPDKSRARPLWLPQSEFVEWIRRLFAHHRSAKITWVDPYMDDVGINLINQCGVPDSTYLVLTEHTPEAPLSDWPERLLHDWGMGPEPKSSPPSRIDNLKSACLSWTDTTHGAPLRVMGLPPDELHDRMILIRDAQLKPIAGYYLSHSLQRENGNIPLTITSIPDNGLRNLADYLDDMVERVLTAQNTQTGCNFNPIIFDSATHTA